MKDVMADKVNWEQELARLAGLLRSSPEDNRRRIAEFLAVSEKARSENSLEAAKAFWWIASMVDQRMAAKEAELLYVFALQKLELTLGKDSPLLAGVLYSLAYYLAEKGRLTEAEPHFRRIIALRSKADDKQSAEMSEAIKDFAKFLRKDGRNFEAEQILEETLNKR